MGLVGATHQIIYFTVLRTAAYSIQIYRVPYDIATNSKKRSIVQSSHGKRTRRAARLSVSRSGLRLSAPPPTRYTQRNMYSKRSSLRNQPLETQRWISAQFLRNWLAGSRQRHLRNRFARRRRAQIFSPLHWAIHTHDARWFNNAECKSLLFMARVCTSQIYGSTRPSLGPFHSHTARPTSSSSCAALSLLSCLRLLG